MPRRTFGYFGLRRRGPDALSADKLLFWTAQVWPRRTFGYFGLRRRGPEALSADELLFWMRRRVPDALSADNNFSGSRYYAGQNSVFDVFYLSVNFRQIIIIIRARVPISTFSSS